MARALYAAGVRQGELVHNCFAYHFTPAGMMIETGARALGCPVFPGGVGNTDLQVKAITELKPVAYGGTPSFLKGSLDRALQLASTACPLKTALHAAAPSP